MRFFFYGTLLEGSVNSVARDLHALLEPVGPERVAGMLYAFPDPEGWFPALIPGEGKAHGMVYSAHAHFSPADLARIDAYEDYDPAHPARSLYLRREVLLTCGGLAQAYVWNKPLPEGAQHIAGGDFRRWLATGGLPQFTGLRDT